jgi:hypothetical protein
MDTNLLQLLVAQSARVAPADHTAIDAIKLIFEMLGPVMAALILFIQSKTTTTLKEVHVAVNSERTANLEEIKRLHSSIEDLQRSIAFSDEWLSGEDRGYEEARTRRTQRSPWKRPTTKRTGRR